tara:strand:- start:359 stop:721 length:363 start_codon:yes stop_codon:yes gene_type:complete
MVNHSKKVMVPRAYIDTAVVEPSIKKTSFVPMMPGGKPQSQEKVDAMPQNYKCVGCGGFRVYGVGNPRKAAVGFIGKTFYFCSACGKWLRAEDAAGDLEKMDMPMRIAARAALQEKRQAS